MPVVAPDKQGSTRQGADTFREGSTPHSTERSRPQHIQENRFERFDASRLQAPSTGEDPGRDFLTAKAAQKRFSRIQPDDIRDRCPIEIPKDAAVLYSDQNGGNVKMERGYRQIEFAWSKGNVDYYARWHTKEHDGLKDDRPVWRVSRRPRARGQSYREELIELRDGTPAFVPSSVFRQAQRFLRSFDAMQAGGEDPQKLQDLREAALRIIDRVHFRDSETQPTSGTVPWQHSKAA
jgi:hypothetical protein